MVIWPFQIKVVPSCITAFYDESVYLDGYDEPQNLSSIANNWMCRYVQREYDLMQSVPQTLANIEDSFISSSAAVRIPTLLYEKARMACS